MNVKDYFGQANKSGKPIIIRKEKRRIHESIYQPIPV